MRRPQARRDFGYPSATGLYVTGLNVLRRRRSSFISGAERDSKDLSEHLQRHFGRVTANR